MNQNGKIAYSAKTDRGLMRQVNQDAIAAFVYDDLGLFVLSDGMGGHSSGELASSHIVTEFSAYWDYLMKQGSVPEMSELGDQVCDVIRHANQHIHDYYNVGQICGATLVVLLVKGDAYTVFYVGDSRIYTPENNRLKMLTTDDIWDNLPETRATYTPEQIAAHESYGKLVQAIGTWENFEIHRESGAVTAGQLFLLCSDGLFKYSTEANIAGVLQNVHDSRDLGDATGYLLDNVFRNGAGDNVSVILVRVV